MGLGSRFGRGRESEADSGEYCWAGWPVGEDRRPKIGWHRSFDHSISFMIPFYAMCAMCAKAPSFAMATCRGKPLARVWNALTE